MKITSLVKSLLLTSILPFCAFTNEDDTTQKEEGNIEFVNNNGDALNDKTLQIPVTATVNDQVLNVKFKGFVPVATIKVNNALTGETISQQTMTAVQGVTCSVPVAGVSFGNITITNERSGEIVSGEFEVDNGKQ